MIIDVAGRVPVLNFGEVAGRLSALKKKTYPLMAKEACWYIYN